MTTDEDLHVQRGGSDGPMLLLLHGMGATGAVWSGPVRLLGDHWPGQWVVPDLPGHGRSGPLQHYTFEGMAAPLSGLLEDGRQTAVLGHSLGGVVALALAAAEPGVLAVAGVGIKVRWSADELARAADVAARPARVFDTREEAEERAVKVAGLAGLASADSATLRRLVADSGDGWRLALDPRALGIGAPDMPALLAPLGGRTVVLGSGERDPLSPPEHLAELVPDPVTLPGLGHNAHVEDPGALLPLLARLRVALDSRGA